MNWKKIRLGFLNRSIPIPAPIFFLIFLVICWACFTLYFKIERTNAFIDSLERRTDALESQLESYGDPAAGDETPYEGNEDDFDVPPPSHFIEM